MKRFKTLVSPDKILDISSDSGSIVSEHDIVYYTDWFLPSEDEAIAMYTNLHAFAVGGFNVGYFYWSSTEQSAGSARRIRFSDGNPGSRVKSGTDAIRACRSFTAVGGAYVLRDTGPAGGLIFYIDGGTTYYEAAPSDQSISKAWSNVTDVEIGTTNTAIGTGQANTNAIIIQQGGASDWFLPSKDELAAMYTNLHDGFGVGGFANENYWSSTESNSLTAWMQGFVLGTQATDWKYSPAAQRIRACRTFIAAGGAYSLRDVGPTGGLIFYIDGSTTYYEAAPSDQSDGKIWSNIDSTLIGTTDTIIGEGQNNTNEIIAQGGHTDSSAKLCDDYDNTYVAHTDSAAKLCDEVAILKEINIVVNDVTLFKDGEVLAMIFNGSTSYIINYIVNQLSSTIVGSFVAWIKTKDITAIQEIISFGDTDADTRIQFDITDTGRLRTLVGVSGATKWALDTDDVVFVNGVWTHVALVTDGTDPVLYVNGIAVDQAFSDSTDKTYWFSQMSGLDNGRIGCGNWNGAGNADFTNGLVNGVKVFIGALTGFQVSQIWSSEKSRYNL